MAAVGPRAAIAAVRRRAAIVAPFLFLVAQMRADQASDVRSQLQAVAAALAAANPAEAMIPFDKSCENYEKLTAYFEGLTNAFQIANEIDVIDEQDAAAEAKLTVNWTITLIDLGSNYTDRRRGEVNVRLVLKRRTWKIVDFTPIEIFDPRLKPAPKNR